MTVLRCTVTTIGKAKLWVPTHLQDGKKLTPLEDQDAVFMVDAGEPGRSDQDPVKADLRKHPPFYQILPCPYCGVEEDRNHEVLLHVDSRLGTPIGKE